MKSFLKIPILIIISFFLLITVSYSTTMAQESEPTLILYVSDTCKYCEALIEDLTEEGLIDTVKVVEISDEPFHSEFEGVIESCGVRTAVPLLYDGYECFQGQFNAKDQIYLAQGLEPESTVELDENIENSDEEGVDITEVEDEEESSNLKEPTDISNDSTSTESDTNEETTLSEKIFGTEEDKKPPDIPTINLIIMLIAPITLLALGYYIITKMKV